MIETAAHNLRRQLGVARRAVTNVADFARHPDKVPALGAELVGAVQSLVRQASVTDHARSPLWTERSLRRRFEVLRIPLDDTKRAAKALGGSVNDIFVAGAASAAGAYHRAKGAEVDELRITMPVSTRSDRSMGGNAFAPARLSVPVGASGAVDQFTAIRDRLTATKHERALEFAGARRCDQRAAHIDARADRSPASGDRRLRDVERARRAVRSLHRGRQDPGQLPDGPNGGTAFNLTVLSSSGWLDMGVNIDLAAIDDPELLRECLEDAYAELLSIG